jgi:hypothetical protein
MTINADTRKRRQAKDQQGKCWYCALQLRDDMTWEHVVSRADKGSDKISNLKIAHSKCNALVGTLRVPIKFALHDIGWTLGSDAFFLLASQLKGQANDRKCREHRQRRPKPPPPAQHQANVLRLVEQLPPELACVDGMPIGRRSIAA